MTRDSSVRAVAVVLAAGAGVRLGGVAKAALVLPDGRTFLAAIVEAARSGGCSSIVVVAAEPHLEATRKAAAAAAADAALGDALVVNPEPERGMASSFAAGLTALGDAGAGDVALLWPVDHPLVRAATVAALLAVAGPDRIVVPRCAGRGGHPAAFGIDVWPELMTASSLPRGVRDVVARDPARVVTVATEDRGVALDVDTPADFRRIL
ncbi:MAG: NTP transferase domain-containing protein [Pseudomonadota bacterium]